MKLIIFLLLNFLLLSCGSGSESPEEVQVSGKCSLGPDLIKIMPLGDSITESAKGHNSYRRSLWLKLLNAGCNVDFVGSRKGVWNPRTRGQVAPLNPDFDTDHEGYWGYRTDQVLSFVSEKVREHAPDIVLIHLGSNDVADGESVEDMILELSQLIDFIRAEKPNVSILLAELIPGDNNDGIILLNKEIRKLGPAKNTKESPVIVVDQYSGYEFADSFDGVHPGDTGEEKMAGKWFSGMMSLYGS